MNAHQRRVARRVGSIRLHMGAGHWGPRITVHGPNSPQFKAAQVALATAIAQGRVRLVYSNLGFDMRWPK